MLVLARQPSQPLRLYKREDSNPWITYEHISSGYRQQLTFYDALRSIFQLHNETWNVWTHLLGFLLFLYFLPYTSHLPLPELEADTAESFGARLLHPFSPPPPALVGDSIARWPLYVFISSAMACLGSSTAYHLIGTATADERTMRALAAADYNGVIFLICGSYVPVLQYGFHDAPVSRVAYTAALSLLGAAVFFLVRLEFFHAWRRLRTAMFVALGAFGVVPITHLLFRHEFDAWSLSVVHGLAQMAGSYLVGALIYAAQVPESLVAPEWRSFFDLHLNSHNVWHVFVVLGALAHYRAALELWAAASLAHAGAG